MNRLETAQAAYFAAFFVPAPQPWGVDDDRLAAVLEQAIAAGRPVADDFDWWASLPPGAAA